MSSAGVDDMNDWSCRLVVRRLAGETDARSSAALRTWRQNVCGFNNNGSGSKCDWVGWMEGKGRQAYHLDATCKPRSAQSSMALRRLSIISPSTVTTVAAMVNFEC